MRITSADRLRYGLRPRLATLTAIRPPGSSLRTHSANTSVSICEVLEVGGRDALALQLLLVLLAGEVRRRGDDEGDRPVDDAVHVAGVAADERLRHRQRGEDLRRRRTAPAGGSGRRTASSRGSPGRPRRSSRSSSCVAPSSPLPVTRARRCGYGARCYSARVTRVSFSSAAIAGCGHGALDDDTTASDGQAGGPWGPGHHPSSVPPPLPPRHRRSRAATRRHVPRHARPGPGGTAHPTSRSGCWVRRPPRRAPPRRPATTPAARSAGPAETTRSGRQYGSRVVPLTSMLTSTSPTTARGSGTRGRSHTSRSPTSSLWDQPAPGVTTMALPTTSTRKPSPSTSSTARCASANDGVIEVMSRGYAACTASAGQLRTSPS